MGPTVYFQVFSNSRRYAPQFSQGQPCSACETINSHSSNVCFYFCSLIQWPMSCSRACKHNDPFTQKCGHRKRLQLLKVNVICLPAHQADCLTRFSVGGGRFKTDVSDVCFLLTFSREPCSSLLRDMGISLNKLPMQTDFLIKISQFNSCHCI